MVVDLEGDGDGHVHGHAGCHHGGWEDAEQPNAQNAFAQPVAPSRHVFCQLQAGQIHARKLLLNCAVAVADRTQSPPQARTHARTDTNNTHASQTAAPFFFPSL